MNLAYAVSQVGMSLIVAERLGTLGGGPANKSELPWPEASSEFAPSSRRARSMYSHLLMRSTSLAETGGMPSTTTTAGVDTLGGGGMMAGVERAPLNAS